MEKLWARLRCGALLLDAIVLVRVFRTSIQLREWAGISQRTLENVVIAVFIVFDFSGMALDPHSSLHAAGLETAVSVGTLLFWVAASEEHRTFRLFSSTCGFLRIGLTSCFFSVTASVVFPDCSFHSWLWATGRVFYVGLIYLSSLPAGGNGKKRKRRLSAAKLKELFGGSWMPQPEGVTH